MNFHISLKRLCLFAARILLLFTLYQILRFIFLVYHWNDYRQFASIDILWSFILGARFDIAAIAWINSGFAILFFIPGLRPRLERWFFLSLNLFFLCGTVVDFELVKFNGKRLSRDFFSMADDIWEQLPQIMMNYWYAPLILGLIFFVILKLDERIRFPFKEKRFSFSWSIFLCPLVLGLDFVAIRGGLQHKSIHVQNAYTQGDPKLGILTLNTPYHFLRTFNAERLKAKRYFPDEEMMEIVDAESGIAGNGTIFS